MGKSVIGSMSCLLVLATALAGCGADEQPKEGSADIVKSNPPPTELSPEFQERQAEKMRHGGFDPNNPDASQGHR
jgi:hypothetical protein